jgi:hypothetical protein
MLKVVNELKYSCSFFDVPFKRRLPSNHSQCPKWKVEAYNLSNNNRTWVVEDIS